MKRQCQHRNCKADSAEGYFGVEYVVCGAHRQRCLLCDKPASLYSPVGQLCAAHTDQACAIEMHGAYPSHAAIKSIIQDAAVTI